MHSLTAWCADHAGQVPPVSALQTCEPEQDQPHEHVLSERAAAQQEQSPPHRQSLHLREFRPRPPADSNSLANSDHQGRRHQASLQTRGTSLQHWSVHMVAEI